VSDKPLHVVQSPLIALLIAAEQSESAQSSSSGIATATTMEYFRSVFRSTRIVIINVNHRGGIGLMVIFIYFLAH
jgi:hypothetical protein